ncbi:MAG: hypothetical protein EP299_06505, partial [Acidobacteria bacterium]
MPSPRERTSCRIATALSVAALLATALLLVALPGTARADDKDLLVGGGCEGPNVFALMDISSSMKKFVDRPPWSTYPQAPAYHDDPAGRHYQVRQALYEVLKATSGVHFGFAQFPNMERFHLRPGCSKIRAEDELNPGTEILIDCPDPRDGACCASEREIEIPGDLPDDHNSCLGIEPNEDDHIDSLAFNDGTIYYNFRYPTTTDPDSGLRTGDLLPLNWTDDNRMALMRRLAPNIIVDGEDNPHFELNDYIDTSKRTICVGSQCTENWFLADENQKPLGQREKTPMANALKDFRHWYEDWKPLAEAADPDFAAKETAIILLSDVIEGCCDEDYFPLPPPGHPDYLPGWFTRIPGGDSNDCDDREPLARIAQLYQGTENVNELCPRIASKVLDNPGVFGDGLNIKTYVISFATRSSYADEVARCGGTEAAYFPETKEELVQVLGGIIQTIKTGSKSFSPAASPPRSFNAEDKVAFSSFLPIADTSHWDGHLRAFVRPVPVTPEGKPDDDVACGGSVTEACFLWDAGAQLVDQAPTDAEAAADNLKIGPAADERRVWYTMERDSSAPYTVARARRLLNWDGATTDNEWDDLIQGLGIIGGGGFCGDAACGLGENACSCSADCGSPPPSETGFCGDGVDNDCDAQPDCSDSDCSTDPACAFCGDGTCDPGETPCDCVADCGSPASDEIGFCNDGVDNDCDSQLDCADSDCSGDPVCASCGDSTCDPGENSCSCDADCGAPPGSEIGLCTDAIDNDCDTLLDCGDPDCAADAACSTCGNGACEPGESPCDCPSDCGGPPASETGFCADGIDNDCDGDVDCDDLDCLSDAACSGGCSGPGDSLLVPIAQSSDDIEEDDDNGEMVLASSDLDLTTGQHIGLRFAIDIPAGATITAADIELENRIERSGTSNMTLWAEKTGHAVEFTSVDYNLTDRPLTDGSASWDWTGTIGSHVKIYTADISSVVQEVVNEPFWDAGNAIAFRLDNAGDKRDVYAYDDDDPDQFPVLRVTYTCSGSKPAAPAALIATTDEQDRAKDVVRETLKIKTATVADEESDSDVDISYVLGDIFHSDPTVVGPPADGRFFSTDFMDNGKACDDSSDPNPGYRCFYEKHQYRRQVLLFGANDGQIHAVDMGIFHYTSKPAEDGYYDNGTGNELFAHIPRGVLPSVLTQAETSTHNWDVDGPIRVADVFIDPDHNGVPAAADREWRTTAIGGLRRGGRLYYALDLTQPDELDSKGVGTPINGYVPSCWDGDPASACGPLGYGAPLWEFTDTWDEDPSGMAGNGHPDLGDTWSIPNVWPIRVLVDDGTGGKEIETKFVAIFGGGLDTAKLGDTGNWLYMVDIETGEPIYKRRLGGSAPSEPAAVDIHGDGHVDT